MATALKSRKLGSEFNNGVWDQDPWFLRAEYEELFNRVGFSLEQRMRAVECLRRVYPPEVCRDMLQRSWGDGGVIVSLFSNITPLRLLPLLKLGLDLEAVSPDWDGPLVKKLRAREHYHATEFEFAVWASLKRHGYDCLREPSCDGGKRPDFLLHVDRRRYALELKTLSRSELDALAFDVGNVLGGLASDVAAPRCLASIRPSQEYMEKYKSPEGRAQVLAELPEIEDAFRRGATALHASGFSPGRYPVEPYGYWEVEVARFKLGAFECCFVPKLSPHRQAIKLMNIIKDACKQLPSSAVGVLLIDVGELDAVEFLHAQLRAKEHENPRLFRNCNFVLLRGTFSDLANDGARRVGTVVVTMGTHRLTIAEEGLVQVLTHGVPQDWLRVPERWRSVNAGKVELKPGATVSAELDFNDL